MPKPVEDWTYSEHSDSNVKNDDDNFNIEHYLTRTLSCENLRRK